VHGHHRTVLRRIVDDDHAVAGATLVHPKHDVTPGARQSLERCADDLLRRFLEVKPDSS
jgi:hypothetical protein